MATVYFGTSIPYLQQHGWRQMEIRAEEVARRTPFRNTEVIGGILERECNALLGAALRDASKV
jgi:tRNA(adenine34) deaminase